MPYGLLIRNGRQQTVLDENNPCMQILDEYDVTGVPYGFPGGYLWNGYDRRNPGSILFVRCLPGQGYATGIGGVYHTSQNFRVREVVFASDLPVGNLRNAYFWIQDAQENMVYTSNYALLYPGSTYDFKGYSGTSWSSPPGGYNCTDQWFCTLVGRGGGSRAGGSAGSGRSTYYSLAYGIRRNGEGTRIDRQLFDISSFTAFNGAPVYLGGITVMSAS